MLPTRLIACLVVFQLAGVATQDPDRGADWPQFRGPVRDGVSQSEILRQWGPEGPRVLWRRPVGHGFAAPSVVAGRLVLFHRVGDEEVVEAVDADTGASLWRVAYPTAFVENLVGFDPGPRAAPTIVDGVVYTCGVERIIQALDLKSGDLLWRVDGTERFQGRRIPFGASCIPLVWKGRVMLNLSGGNGAGIVALDTDTGETVWTATDDEASHGAGLMARVGGIERALFYNRYGLVDLDPQDGRVRHVFPWSPRSRLTSNGASPVVLGSRVFISEAYAVGAVLLELTGEGFVPIWSGTDILSTHYVTPVHHAGVLYGIHGRQPDNPSLRAVDVSTGAVLWTEPGFGTASILVAGDTLILLHENGDLILADADPERYRPRIRTRVLAPTVRAYPALAGGILYARNESELMALDLRPAATVQGALPAEDLLDPRFVDHANEEPAQ